LVLPFQNAFARQILSKASSLAQLHNSVSNLILEIVHQDESELVAAINVVREKKQFTSILQCTPEMVKEEFAENPIDCQHHLDSLESLHRKASREDNNKLLKPLLEESKRGSRSLMLSEDLKSLFYDPVLGTIM
jgi:hypothetical protein